MSYSKDAWTLSSKAAQGALENLQSEVAWLTDQVKVFNEQLSQKESVIRSLELSRDSWKKIAEDAVRDSMDLATRLSRIGLKNFDYQPGVKDEQP